MAEEQDKGSGAVQPSVNSNNVQQDESSSDRDVTQGESSSNERNSESSEMFLSNKGKKNLIFHQGYKYIFEKVHGPVEYYVCDS